MGYITGNIVHQVLFVWHIIKRIGPSWLRWIWIINIIDATTYVVSIFLYTSTTIKVAGTLAYIFTRIIDVFH